MTRIGTSYFLHYPGACAYYIGQGYPEDTIQETVDAKLAAGEIHLGKPEIKRGQRLVEIDRNTRYAIENDQ